MMYERKNWLIEGICEWDFLWSQLNWVDFHVIDVYLENDTQLGGYEVMVIIFGIGFRWRWNHTNTQTMKEIKETIALYNQERKENNV